MAGITLKRLQQSFPKAEHCAFHANILDKSEKEQRDTFSLTILKVKMPKPFKPLSSRTTHLLRQEDELDLVTAIKQRACLFVRVYPCIGRSTREIGLDAQTAKELALQTINGSAKLMENSDFSPEELRDQVTSPNGTTQVPWKVFHRMN